MYSNKYVIIHLVEHTLYPGPHFSWGVCVCVFIYLYRCAGFLNLFDCEDQIFGVFLNYFSTSCLETRDSY